MATTSMPGTCPLMPMSIQAMGWSSFDNKNVSSGLLRIRPSV